MKYLYWLFFLLAVPVFAGTIPITGSVRDPQGNAFNGQLRLTLSYGASNDFCSNTVVVANVLTFRIQNGVLPSSARITPNDCIQPANTFYTAEYLTNNGQKIAQNVFYVTGSQFNFSTATPTPLQTSNISFDLAPFMPQMTKDCSKSAGSTAGAKIAACISALPTTGGTADARTLTTGDINQDIFSGITKPVTLLLGHATFNVTIGWSIPDKLRILGECGGTLINYSGSNFWLDTGASGIPNDVELGCFDFTSGTSSLGMLRVGSTATDFNNSLIRLRWHLHDLYLTGPGAAGTGQVGMSITQYLDWTLDQITILNFERPAIFDRGGNSHFSRVRFQAFEFGAWWTIKGGTGTAADGSNQDVCTTCEFLGPTWGIGDTVTIQHQSVTFINALYECQVGGVSTNLLDITGRGASFGDSAYFTDINGLFSAPPGCGAGNPLHTINFSTGYSSPRFIGTVVPVTGYPAIQFGTPYAFAESSAKFTDVSVELANLVITADPDGTRAHVFAPYTVAGANFNAYRNQSILTDTTGILRLLSSSAAPALAAGKGWETFYQASGDQALTTVIDRSSSTFKPWLIQPSALLVVPNGTNTMLTVNGSGSILRGSITGSAVSPAIQYVSGSTGSVSASGTASVTLNWSTTWADTNFYPLCQVTEATNLDTLEFRKVTGVSTTQITAVIFNNDSGGAHTGTLNCMGFHP